MTANCGKNGVLGGKSAGIGRQKFLGKIQSNFDNVAGGKRGKFESKFVFENDGFWRGKMKKPL